MKASVEVQFRILSGDKVYTATEYFKDLELPAPKIGNDTWYTSWYTFLGEFEEKFGLRAWALLAEVAMKLFDGEAKP